MAIILHIETATDVCSVALASDGNLINEKTATDGREHAKLLTVLIDDLMRDSGYIYKQLDAVAVSRGPGSYTGLRIGVAAAKGICYATDKPLIAADTLTSMAWMAKKQWIAAGNSIDDTLFCPMIDARRMEVYTTVFDNHLEMLQPVKAIILEPGTFEAYKGKKLVFFGDGAEKYAQLISSETEAFFFLEFCFNAEGLIKQSHQQFVTGQFEDPAYFEPFYLKDFVGFGNAG
jgi:tRNA threonylcarbamoyladenosine biosynthesis protein TsaB